MKQSATAVAWAAAGLVAIVHATWADMAGEARVKAAQAFRTGGESVAPASDGTIFCEAEEFKAERPVGEGQGWRAGFWGENYYAATLANTFLSRKAFLGAPENCDETVATINVDIKEGGRYLVLVRYEAAYRFETQFRVKVEQGGKPALDRLYGARDNLKVWAFGKKLQKEVAWGWGACENVVWEGHDAYANLRPGPAKISLIAGRQPAPRAKRNVDLVMLTKDEAQVKKRIETESYLPLDGWLTQAGDVWMKVHNGGGTKVKVSSQGWQQHSPYWVHIRNWKPVSVDVEPGQSSDWVEVGSTMDTLNDGQWNFSASGPCKIEFGVKNAAGRIESVRTMDANGSLLLVGLADERYSRRFETTREAVNDLVAYLGALPVHGKTPTLTPVYALSGTPEILPLFGAIARDERRGRMDYVDWRSKDSAQLEEVCAKLSAADRKNILVVSLGDEIALPAPTAKDGATGFVKFLKSRDVDPKSVDPASGGDWAKIAYNPDPKLRESNPGLYYWSNRYLYYYGIQEQKKLTDVLRKRLPRAQIGANFSPHHCGGVNTYLGEVFKWVTCFREDGMTLPWAEDYIWQVPVGSPQMNGINLDLFRAGLRGKPDRRILYYVMPHAPGNTPNMWRRMFFSAVGHGATILNLFEFAPVWAAYTENHVTGNEMYGMVLKTLREFGLYEDIVQTGHLRQAPAGLWFSETGDIWGDNEKSFGPGKRGLYVAILGQQLPLDFLVDQDAANGTLGQYKVLYLTDNHVSRTSSQKIAKWVKNGGRLLATAGAGMFDESNQPNQTLRELLGVEQTDLVAPGDAQASFIKQDLPFLKAIETVTMAGADPAAKIPVFGIVSRVTAAKHAQIRGTFGDKSPAVVANKTGKGETVYCGFLPGLSYFKPATPLKPLDRGSTDDAMSHFIPTEFDANAGDLIGSVARDVVRPVASDARLIESTVIESKVGTVITLNNWSGKPVKGLKLTANIALPKSATLASGGEVETIRTDDKTVYRFDLDIADALVLRD